VLSLYFIDTNIFLELELKQKRSEECKEFLRRVLKGEIEAFTSDFNLDSVAIVMDAKGCEPRFVSDFLLKIMTFEGLTIYSLNMVDRIVAAKYMQKHKLTFDDAVTYFIAKSLEIKELVSFDDDFDGLPEIKRLEPINILK
jgi:predicted nucleic acid-binding protein